MTEDVRAIALRLVDTLGHGADPDSFSDEDAWSFVIDLRDYGARGLALPSPAVAVLHELGAAIGIYPGAPADVWAPALELELGPSPYPAHEVAEVMKVIHTAVNGQFEAGRPRVTADDKKLTGGEPAGPHTPLKSLDLGQGGGGGESS